MLKVNVSQANGRDQIMHFLPAPGNYGFIPSTCLKKEDVSKSEALDILVISETISTGSVIEVVPIGILTLKDKHGLDHKIIAIPADKERRIIDAEDLYGFQARFPMAKHLVEEWLVAIKGRDSVQIIGWRDELAAMQVIDKWAIK